MPSFKEFLEISIARAGKNAADHNLCCSLSVGEIRQVLALLAAAKGLLVAAEESAEVDTPSMASARRAIALWETAP